jgi:methionyl-tRNA formyltransferase
MNILILTVSSNYHAPILLRNLFTQLPNDKFRIMVSLANTRLGLRRILARYGWKYTVYKIIERYKFKRMMHQESTQKVSFEKKQFLTLSQVLGAFSIQSQECFNINSRDSLNEINSFRPDLIISLYFDQIIREPLLSNAPNPPLNLHPSLLPAYAGSSPTFWVLANGEHQTGITIHEMAKKIDGGKIIYQRVIPIEQNDTQFLLYRRCTLSYCEPLLDIVCRYKRGDKLMALPTRTDVEPSYFSKITNVDIDKFLARSRKFI